MNQALSWEEKTTLARLEDGYCSWLLLRGKRLFKAESGRRNERDKLACIERETGNEAQLREGSCARELERSHTKFG